MKDNSFEKQIAEKLNRMEVRVPDSLLESVFEARAARRKKSGMYGKLILAVSVAVLSLVAVAVYMGRSGNGSAPQSGNTAALANGQGEQTDNAALSAAPDAGETLAAEQAEQQLEAPGKGASGINAAAESAAEKALTPLAVFKGNKTRTTKRKDNSAFKTALSGVSQNRKQSESYGFAGILSSPDDYFNLASSSRPELAYEEHNGNSHLFVYKTAVSSESSDKPLIFCRPTGMKPFEMVYGFEAFSPVAAKAKAYRSRTASKKPLFLDLLYMPAWNTHASADGGEYAAIIDGISASSYNTQFGIRLSVPLKQAFSVFGGVNYRAQSNRFKGDITYYSDETRVDKHVSYINDPVKGVVQVVRYDTVNFTSQNVRELNFTNTYTLIQLPLGVSYNFGYGRFDFACHGSVLMNAFVRSSGQALDAGSGDSKAFSSSRPFYGIGGGLGFMAAARISSRFRLIAEPGLQFYGINSRKAGNNISEKALSGGLSLGLRYTVF